MTTYIQIEKIGPESAAKMLEKNDNNRKLSRRIVDQYAESMLRGEWIMNGEAIQVSESGRLLNGQHRLNAILKSGSTIECLVVRNLPDESFSTFDQGIKRTAAQILQVSGEFNASSVANGLKLLHQYLTQGSPSSVMGLPTPKKLMALLESYPQMRRHASKSCSLHWIKKYVRQGSYAFLRTVFDEVDAAASELFFEELESGANLHSHSPVLLLRERLMQQDARTPMRTDYRFALIFKAFRLYRTDTPVKVLRVNLDSETESPFTP